MMAKNKKTVSAAQKAKQQRLDSWVNAVTGLGYSGRDKALETAFEQSLALTDIECDSMFHGDDLARRIVCAIVDDAMRQGFDLESEEDDADATDLQLALDRWGVRAKAHEAAIWGRCFGGGVIYLGVDGIQREPLDDEKVGIGALKALRVMDKRDLQVASRYSDPLSAKYGEPMTYTVNPTVDAGLNSQGVEVHESRLVIFPGAMTSTKARRENAGWDHSVLQPVYPVLRSVSSNWQSVCHLMTDFGQGVFMIKGLMDMIAAGQEDTVRTRMEIVDIGRSVVRSLILDADSEGFERKATPIAGVSELLIQGWQRLAAGVPMPVTKLMGMSPAGLNATGDADIRNWYDDVQHYRSTVLTPRLERITRIVARSEGNPDADGWSIAWPSLWQMTAKEEADLRKVLADTDSVNIAAGVYLPEEAAVYRSGEGLCLGFPTIDLELREKMLASETAKALEGEPESTGGATVPPSLPAPMPPHSPLTKSDPSQDSEQGKAAT